MIIWPIIASIVAVAVISLLAFHRQLHSGKGERVEREAALADAPAGTPVMVGGMIRARLCGGGVDDNGDVWLVMRGRKTHMPAYTVTIDHS